MEILDRISEALQRGKAKDVRAMVQEALDSGIAAQSVLNEGLLAGMNVVGVKFKNNEVYVPDVLIAARAMKAGTEILKPQLIADGVKANGKLVIGTVKGDLHDIGKNLVGMMMEGKGLEVIDLGTDVTADKFVSAAIENNAQIICCSALLTTTMGEMKGVVEAAKAAGIRDKVVIMVGGAPVNDSFAKSIGADIYSPDAASAAEAAMAALQARA
jgi:corrinoid protein of di/trimethylamine methyltransferase